MLYVPKGYSSDKGMALLVWLHGAGGSGNISATLSALADEFGIIVLAPDSREWTWGSILGNWEPDLDFLQLAMQQAQHRCAIDRERIWLGGFSDGASFSLALGISYGNIFRRVYAGAPGLMQPIAANGKPPIFISHGKSDQTMPIDVTSRQFVPRLKRLGYDVTYREYRGTSPVAAGDSSRSDRLDDGNEQITGVVMKKVWRWSPLLLMLVGVVSAAQPQPQPQHPLGTLREQAAMQQEWLRSASTRSCRR